MYVKEQAKWGANAIVWVIVIAIVAAALALVGSYLYGVQQNIIRNQQIHTTGYVQAQVDQMSKGLTQFAKNEVDLAKSAANPKVVAALNAQQMGIVMDTWSAYDSIPQDAKDSVPQDIRSFLTTHPRNWTP